MQEQVPPHSTWSESWDDNGDNLNENFARELKEQANKLYDSGNYNEAISKYTMLIELFPRDEIYYGNRSACYMMLKDYERAMADARVSVRLNPQYIKGHSRMIKCALMFYEVNDMNTSVDKMRAIDPTNDILKYQSDSMWKLYECITKEAAAVTARDYGGALQYLEMAMVISPLCLDFKVKKAEYFVYLGRLIESEKIAQEILKKDKINSNAHWVLGMCSYQTDLEQSLKHFEESIRLCRNSTKDRTYYQKAKTYIEQKQAGNDAYKSQEFFRAYQIYNKALQIDPKHRIMQGTLYFNISLASYKLKLRDTCIKACTNTLKYIPSHVKALMRRAQCYMDGKQYAMAVEDLQTASNIEPSAEITHKLREARKLLEETCKSDWHWILGISKNASESEITKAYRDLTRLHHPDRHTNATEEKKKFHEQKCKDITHAYRLLMEQMSSRSNSNNCRKKESN